MCLSVTDMEYGLRRTTCPYFSCSSFICLYLKIDVLMKLNLPANLRFEMSHLFPLSKVCFIDGDLINREIKGPGIRTSGPKKPVYIF
jgi:hypothetical protein